MKESSFLKFVSDSDAVIKSLREIRLFAALSNEEIKELLTMSKFRSYEQGETIIQEGDSDNWIYFLFSGSVNVMAGGQLIKMLKEKGDIFGEIGVLDGAERSASVVADEDYTLCVAIDGSILDRFVGREDLNLPCLVYRVFSEVFANRLRETTRENVLLRNEVERLRLKLRQS